MAKYLGIDFTARGVRAVLLHGSYRKLVIGGVAEAELSESGAWGGAIKEVVAQLHVHGESISVGIDGVRTFLRNVRLPATAAKQIAEILPYELESDLPVELSDAVYDHLVLKAGSNDESIHVLAIVARTDDVRARIDEVHAAAGVEPERIVSGPFALAALSAIIPELDTAGIVGVVDLDEARTDVVLLTRGEPLFARTISRGTHGLPESAHPLALELKQTLLSARTFFEGVPEILYLTGSGAGSPGAAEYLAAQLGIPVVPLPLGSLELGDPALAPSLPRFAKSLGFAIALAPRSKVLNLRRGPLGYESGYGFLREKIPLLSGLAAVIIVSFLFSTWAELRALSNERVTLQSALKSITHEVFKEETSDPERAMELLDKGPGASDEDPLPHVDAFDVMVQLSQVVPENVVHDIEEFDVQRSHAVVHGVVSTIPDAQQIAQSLKTYRCFQDVKIVRTNQVVGEDRQKYVLEFDVKCPNEKEKGPPATASSASAGGVKP